MSTDVRFSINSFGTRKMRCDNCSKLLHEVRQKCVRHRFLIRYEERCFASYDAIKACKRKEQSRESSNDQIRRA